MVKYDPRPKESSGAYRHATTEDREIPWYTKLPKQVLTNDCRGVYTTVKADISKDRLGNEQDVPRSV